MENNLKELLKNISPKSIKELVEDHVNEVNIDENKKEMTLTIDKKYAFNTINSTHYIGGLIKGVKKTFGEDYKTILKLSAHLMRGENIEHHDREMNTPYKIHYR